MNYSRLVVETSGKCNLACSMCPTAFYGNRFKHIMEREIFDMVLQYVEQNMIVILTGWGEPLLDPHIEKRIYECKRRGCTVYIATNATLLTPEKAKGLLSAGLDGLSISLDAGSEEIYSQIRKGDFSTVVQNISYLVKLREKNFPDFWIDSSFVTMKNNSADLENFINMARKIGLNSVSITPKYLCFSKKDYQRFYLPADEILALIERVKRDINTEPMEIRTYALDNFFKNDCLSEATKTPFISFNGDVSACCNLGHPAPRYLVEDDEVVHPYQIFGNIMQTPLSELWEQDSYKGLRTALKSGATPRQCAGCSLAPNESR